MSLIKSCCGILCNFIISRIALFKLYIYEVFYGIPPWTPRHSRDEICQLAQVSELFGMSYYVFKIWFIISSLLEKILRIPYVLLLSAQNYSWFNVLFFRSLCIPPCSNKFHYKLILWRHPFVWFPSPKFSMALSNRIECEKITVPSYRNPHTHLAYPVFTHFQFSFSAFSLRP